MQEVQLFIKDINNDYKRVDLFSDETISLTQSIQNSRDIGKVFTDFSKQFNLPASRTNNKLFKHHYEASIVGGYDARTRQEALIKLNGVDFVKGKIHLQGTNLKYSKAHTYKVTFYGDTVTLKDLFSDDKLGALTWLDNFYDTYDDATIVTNLQNGKSFTVDSVTYSDALVVPLITHSKRLFYNSADSSDGNGNVANSGGVSGCDWNELKYALRVDIILKAIEEKYSITFSDDFFNSTNAQYYDLYLWLHRKKGVTTSPTGTDVRQLINTFTLSNQDVICFGSGFNVSDIAINEYYRMEVTTTPVTANLADPYNLIIERDGVEIGRRNTLTGVTTETFLPLDTNGIYRIYVENATGLEIEAVAVTFKKYEDLTLVHTNNFIAPTNIIIGTNFNFLPSQQTPEIKVLDFVSGLFKMFNLIAYVENSEIVVRSLDEFFEDTNTNTYDITKYVNNESHTIDRALIYNNIEFSYEGTESFLSANHNQLFNEEWGTETYTDTSNFFGESYSVKLPFEHFKYERLVDAATDLNTTIQVGYSVDDNEESYVNKPLLFYPIKQTGGDSITIIKENDVVTPTNNYFIPSNSVSLTDSNNINFKAELNEYTNTTFESTLFENHYKKYVQGLFKEKSRLVKIEAYLPLSILLNYKLNDRFIFKGKKYIINSITTELQTGKSKIELLTDFYAI
jgi:hypothetical protein